MPNDTRVEKAPKASTPQSTWIPSKTISASLREHEPGRVAAAAH
jgi:hypothetical protein